MVNGIEQGGYKPGGDKPEQVIVPLSPENRDKYKTVIYQHESATSLDRSLVVAVTSAMQEAGFEIVVDVDTDRSEFDQAVVVRSASEERKEQSVQKALFLGVIEATRMRLEELKKTGEDYQQAAQETAKEMVQTVLGKPGLREAFYKFYGSWQYDFDKIQFVKALFRYGTEFGTELARKYESYELGFTDTGEEMKPVIPLSSHPVIEALVINKVLSDRPDPNGPHIAVSIALDSDSKPAHQALVDNLTTRFPVWLFHYPSEFQYKRDRVSAILRAYKKAKNPQRRGLLRDDILQLMNAYTGDGVIAKSVREDYRSQVAKRDEERWVRRELNIAREIVVDMLSVAIASPDAELNKRAEDIIKKYLPEQKGAAVKDKDPIVLSREELALALIDAIDLVGKDSNLQLIESLGTLIFEDEAVGAQLKNFAQMRMRIITERSRPNVLKVFDRLRHSSRGHLTDADFLEKMKRDFYLTQVEKIVNIQRQRKLTDGEALMFEGLIKRINLKVDDMGNLPPEYYRMMAMAKSGDLTEGQKSTIAWQMYKSFKYSSKNAAPSMVQVIRDIYELALGPVDAVRFPTTGTSHILGAASFLLLEYDPYMFQSASKEDLQVLENYSNRIKEYQKRIEENQPLPEGVLTPEQEMEASKQEWRENATLYLSNVAEELEFIADFYREYLKQKL